jgi:hypothetical protein
MSQPAITTGLDGVTASGNVPTWIIQDAAVTTPLTDQTEAIPASLFSDESTVKIDCYHNMGDVQFTRTPTTRERKRACEKVTVTRKTGETIEGTIQAIYDQQEDADAVINAAYSAVPEGATVYVAIGYGHDSHDGLPARVDIYRGDVTMRSKNQPVEGEDLMFTSTISADLFLEDVTVTPGD